MALLIDSLKAFFHQQGTDRTYWIGYSGGLDSHVLLHLCAEIRKQSSLHLKAVHVNHGLSLHAEDWRKHCEKVCAELQIEFFSKSIHAKAQAGQSPEEVARDLRYAVFAELVEAHDILLTAHQQDDQAETLLVQLLRGAGPKGLSAMPVIKPFASGFHARPLLSQSRAELKAYAFEKHLSWIDDESNEDKSFTRNFLRHSILPLLKQRWPTVTKTLARVAENCAEADALISSVVEQDLKASRGAGHLNLSVKKLMMLDEVRQRQVLRAWFLERGYSVPSSLKLHHIQQDFLKSPWDKLPCMRWDDMELRRYRDELYLMQPLLPHDTKQVFLWDIRQTLNIPGVGELSASLKDTNGVFSDIQQVTVRFRQGGERCYFPKRRCHQLLKHLMQEWGIPPWERDRTPLLFVEDRLISVVGFFLAEDFQDKFGFSLQRF